MADPGPVAWPPSPIRTERLVLREPEARDRAAVIELLASPEVGTYLGGPRPRDELERAMPGAPERRPGLFIVDLDGAMIGQITLTRATGHIRQAAGEAELGYLFLPEAWGCGYAAEACAAVLGHAVRLSSWSTARQIHDETQRIIAHFTTVTPTSDRGARASVGPLIGSSGRHEDQPAVTQRNRRVHGVLTSSDSPAPIQSAQDHWRMVNAPHLVALVRAGARFERDVLVERPEQAAA
jgi:RimJ/RimL family protein N-acetyltransferase